MSARPLFEHYVVKSPREMRQVVGYVDDVDHAVEQFEDVLSHHHFSEFVRCSISSCHTQYKEGYLLLWQSGLVSNVGNCCAKKYLGEKFTSRLDEYQRKHAIPRLQSQLSHIKQGIGHLRLQLESLRQDARDLALQKRALRANFPVLFDFLDSQARSSGDDFPVQVVRLVETPELDETGKPTGRISRKYQVDNIGRLSGLSAIRESALDIVQQIVEPVLIRLEKTETATSSFSVLSELFTDASGLDSRLAEIARILASGRRLFSDETDSLIRKMQGSQSLERECRRYTRTALETRHKSLECAAGEAAIANSTRAKLRRGWQR